MSESIAPALPISRVRPVGHVDLAVAASELPVIVQRAFEHSRRFDLVRLGDTFATVCGRVSWRSFGELIELTFAEAGADRTTVRIDVEPLVSTTLFDYGQGVRDLRAVSDAIGALSVERVAAGLPTDVTPFRPRIAHSAIVGFTLSCVSVVALGIWLLAQPWLWPAPASLFAVFPFTVAVGATPVIGFGTSRIALKLTRLGMRGRRLAIAGVVVSGVVPTFLLGLIVTGLVGFITLVSGLL